MSGARAAQGGFPYYGHQTVAELRRPGGAMDSIDRITGLSFDTGRKGLRIVSAMPDAPCMRCGARGWCGHAGRVACG